MKPHVIFLNPICVQRGATFLAEGPTYVGEVVRSTLETHGLGRCCFPVDRPFRRRSLTRLLGEIAVRLLRALRPGHLNIVAVTHWAASAPFARALLSAVRCQTEGHDPPVMIVGGGPFFVREQLVRQGRFFPDSIEAALREKVGQDAARIYDGIVCGGLGALLQLLEHARSGDLEIGHGRVVPRALPSGYYCLDGSDVSGAGRSPVTPLGAPPFYHVPRRSSFDAMVMFSNSCPNGCDYCATGERMRFTGAEVSQSVRGFRNRIVSRESEGAMRRMGHLRLLDPNPLGPCAREHTFDCLERIRSALGFAPRLHCFQDSHAFLEPDQVSADIEALNIKRLFVGREAVCEPGLGFMGRKHLGRARPAEAVAQEKAGLEAVVRQQQKARKSLRLLLSYILTPVETKESLIRTFRDMVSFRDLSGGTVRVGVQWALLWPSPGTRVIRDQTDLLSDNAYFVGAARDVWDADAVLQRYPRSATMELLASARDDLLSDPGSLLALAEAM